MPYTYEYIEETESLKKKWINPDPQKAFIQKLGGKRKFTEWKLQKYENEIHDLKMILSMNQIYVWNLEDYKKQHLEQN